MFSLIFLICPAFTREPMAAPIEAKRGINLFSLWVVFRAGLQVANSVNNCTKYSVSWVVMPVPSGFPLARLRQCDGLVGETSPTFMFST